MRIKSKTLSVAYKLLIAAVAFVSMAVQTKIFSGDPSFSMFRFFTLQSNLLSAVYFLVDAIYIARRPGDGRNIFPVLKGIQMMAITVTWLVAHFMLGDFTMDGVMGLSVYGLHYVVPIMTLLDWLIFDEKGAIKAKHPLIWTIFPLLYFVYALIASNIGDGIGYGGSRYPYPFIDIDKLGVPRVLLTVAIMTLSFVALGYLFFLLDKGMAKLAEKRSKA